MIDRSSENGCSIACYERSVDIDPLPQRVIFRLFLIGLFFVL